MTKLGKRILFLVIFLLAANILTAYAFMGLEKENETLRRNLLMIEEKKLIIEFNKLFVDEVIGADGEVDFETRLKLEDTVRALEDEQVLFRWKEFVNAQTESEAQARAKVLLSTLAERMSQ